MTQIHKIHDTFDMSKLITKLLGYRWQHECEIIPDYMPPYPDDRTQPSCVVAYTNPKGDQSFLRYSGGPGTGTFWDIYGDDFHNPELALVALSLSAPPPRVKSVIPTHGSEYAPWPENGGSC